MNWKHCKQVEYQRTSDGHHHTTSWLNNFLQLWCTVILLSFKGFQKSLVVIPSPPGLPSFCYCKQDDVDIKDVTPVRTSLIFPSTHSSLADFIITRAVQAFILALCSNFLPEKHLKWCSGQGMFNSMTGIPSNSGFRLWQWNDNYCTAKKQFIAEN